MPITMTRALRNGHNVTRLFSRAASNQQTMDRSAPPPQLLDIGFIELSGIDFSDQALYLHIARIVTGSNTGSSHSSLLRFLEPGSIWDEIDNYFDRLQSWVYYKENRLNWHMYPVSYLDWRSDTGNHLDYINIVIARTEVRLTDLLTSLQTDLQHFLESRPPADRYYWQELCWRIAQFQCQIVPYIILLGRGMNTYDSLPSDYIRARCLRSLARACSQLEDLINQGNWSSGPTGMDNPGEMGSSFRRQRGDP
ncbi:hypothetical protein B0H66DRAFT_641319 [Apodospora peruviana]|uniref:Uncharacterized protein n=1 Tax=Apodospora peruviana TaxID=516989 RepID=A0AAE0M2C7_9PEZI|nr:hypothetical protein B0H66DRAFT_641319 [Apodospora peruviana]